MATGYRTMTTSPSNTWVFYNGRIMPRTQAESLERTRAIQLDERIDQQAVQTAQEAQALGLAGEGTGTLSTGVDVRYATDGSGGGGSRSGGGSGSAGYLNLDEQLGPPPPMPVFTMPAAPSREDRQASNDAAFGQAKDRVAQENRASIDALRNVMAATNRMGSGAEMRGIGGVVQRGQAQLADVVRQQTQHDLAREESVEDRNYSGNLTGAQTSYQGAITGRGQDMNERENRRQSMLTLARMRHDGVIY